MLNDAEHSIHLSICDMKLLFRELFTHSSCPRTIFAGGDVSMKEELELDDTDGDDDAIRCDCLLGLDISLRSFGRFREAILLGKWSDEDEDETKPVIDCPSFDKERDSVDLAL